MAVYSHSRLSTFEQCPLKFKFRYIDNIIPEIEKTIEAHLGSVVHDALEWLYCVIPSGRIPAIDELISYYSEKWEECYSPDIIIVKNGMSVKDYFNKGIQFLVDYYVRNHPFDDGTLECEKEIIIELDKDSEHKIIGFIDRLVYNREKNQFEIHDYKTGNSLPTREKIDNDRQLALYSIAIKEIFGEDKKVVLVWHYLAHNTKIMSTRTDEELEKLKKDTLELINRIESTREFPPRKSVLCGWCEFKSICPLFGGPKIETQKGLDDFNSKEDLLDIW
jgi:putative RecB family exonuclease